MEGGGSDLLKSQNHRYFWHDLALISADIETFHLPFRKELGEASDYFFQLGRGYLGYRVLELGAGSGWLKAKWKIQEYVGVEQGEFTEPCQKLLRTKAVGRGVILGTPVVEVPQKLLRAKPFDSIVCYESFHAFPLDALRVANSELLRPGGTLILIDGKRWWPKGVHFADKEFRQALCTSIPTEWFDSQRIYDLTYPALEILETKVASRHELVQMANPYVHGRILEKMNCGLPIRTIQTQCKDPGFDVDPLYGVSVLIKL